MDAVLYSADRVVTMAPDDGDVDAFVVADGRVRDVGTAAELRTAWAGRAVEERLRGVVTPGLIDAHLHMQRAGLKALDYLQPDDDVDRFIVEMRESFDDDGPEHPPFVDRIRALERVQPLLHALGITTVVDPAVTPDELRGYQAVKQSGLLTMRTVAMPYLELTRGDAAEIDDVMVRFGRGDGDVLLATNIIEAGLDVPRANTMAIIHADRFGLSQLHQLRGRVGRGARRGQVLLFTEAQDAIAPRTLKRLRTLEAFDRLGAGFAISARDLDMRGAGDLLGDTQAGHMRLIGIELYQQLLEDALRTARGETVERWTPELKLEIDGRLPPAWIPDEDLRLSLYARLGRLRGDGALDAFEAELEDRFGELPGEARALLTIARLRERMRTLDIARIDAGPAAIAFTPRHETTDMSAIEGLVEKQGRYLLPERHADPAERLDRLIALLDG